MFTVWLCFSLGNFSPFSSGMLIFHFSNVFTQYYSAAFLTWATFTFFIMLIHLTSKPNNFPQKSNAWPTGVLYFFKGFLFYLFCQNLDGCKSFDWTVASWEVTHFKLADIEHALWSIKSRSRLAESPCMRLLWWEDSMSFASQLSI